MGQTSFTSKISGDKLFASEYMQIVNAINNIEAALNMNIGTPTAQIPSTNLASGIGADKIDPSSNLTIADLSVTGELTLGGIVQFGPSGSLEIVNGHTIFKINSSGVVANDGSRNTFEINDAGEASLKGYVETDSDSILRGELHASSGNVSGKLTVGGNNGIIISGADKEIDVGVNGKIIAGDSYMDSTGFHMREGTIEITDGAATPTSVFFVDSTGSLTATNASVSGSITATGGLIGGISITDSGIHIGGLGQNTTGFSLDSSGNLYAKKGSFTGEIHALSGTLGTLTITGEIGAGATTISSSGIDINQGSINLGNGAFVVDSNGNMIATSGQFNGHITAQSGSVTGTFSAGSVVMSPSGLHVTGELGIRVDSGSIEVWNEDVTPTKVVTIGKYDEEYGIEVRDSDDRQTFAVDSTGNVIVRGTLYGEDGEFTGTVNALAGSFGNVSVTGAITVASGGSIIAGTATISDTGIHLTSGSINLNDTFIVDESGNLKATNVDLSGKISTDDAEVTGVLTVGPKGENPVSQLHLDGINKRIVAGGTILSSSGITISEGTINLGGGQFLVTNDGVLTASAANISGYIYIEGAEVRDTITTKGANITPDGVEVFGKDGVRVIGGSITILDMAATPTEVIRIGEYEDLSSPEIKHWGMIVNRESERTFEINELGDISIKGSINAESGSFLGLLTISNDGIIRAGEEGKARIDIAKVGIIAYNQDNVPTVSIDSETGLLTAVGATISGDITAYSGSFEGSITIGSEGSLVVGTVELDSNGITGVGFSLGPSGVTATQGTIGGWTIGSNSLSAGSLTISAVSGEEKISGPKFILNNSGITAVGGSIGGWDITSDSIESTSIELKSSGTMVVKNSDDQTELVIGLLDDSTYGLYANGIKLNSSGLSSSNFTLSTTGEFEAKVGIFGEGPYKLTLDDKGLFSGPISPTGRATMDSPFGIYTDSYLDEWGQLVAEAGSAYFRGSVAIEQESIIGNGVSTASVSISPGGKIIVGSSVAPHIEFRAPSIDGTVPGGIYAYRLDKLGQLEPTLSVDSDTGNVKVTGEINALQGRFEGNILVGPGSNIRIIGDPSHESVSGFSGGLPGLYLMESGHGTGMIRLVADADQNGIQYSPDGGQTWLPAVTYSGVKPEAITDGNMIIRDTTGAADGILIQRRSYNQEAIFPISDPIGWTPLGHKYTTVIQVTNESGDIIYDPYDPISDEGDYIVNYYDGYIRRSNNSSIPVGSKVKVTYDWNIIDINSQEGIRVHEGNIEIINPDTGSTLIGGGYLYVNGLDVGVFQSDNFVRNGNFSEPSSAYGTLMTEEGLSVPGFPEYEPDENNEWGPFYGDWIQDRQGRIYKYGAAGWIPSKSKTTYDEHHNLTGYAQVAFAPADFLHNIYGYAIITVEGSTEQWGQIEQDIFPYYNHSDGFEKITAEAWEQVVISAGFHWHASHSSDNIIDLEVDELVPHYVFAESTRTSSFTPEWDNVHEEYEGIKYYDKNGTPGQGWTFIDDTDYGTGDNLAWNAKVTTNATGFVDGTKDYVVDNLFVREELATQTLGTGYHCVQLELEDDPETNDAPIINQIWIWHSKDPEREYQDHKLEVSEDGVNWTTIYDTTDSGTGDQPWREGVDGKKFNFEPTKVKYIRDWINGYNKYGFDNNQNPIVVSSNLNQWMEIQARRCMYAVSDEPGSYFEWTFKPHSNVDVWIGYNTGSDRGIGAMEIDGRRVGTINQRVGGHSSHDDEEEHHMNGDEFGVMHEGSEHRSLTYADISSTEEYGLIPGKEVTLRVTFEDIPENEGQTFSLNRIKLEDFRKEGNLYTTTVPVANANFRPVNPYAFYQAYALPSRAKNYIGKGRQIIRGMWDSPANFSSACNCWIRYRVRIKSMRPNGSDPNTHDHVMISHVVMEKGGKPTHFRRSSLDKVPSYLLSSWDPQMPTVTGIQDHHLANESITGPKIAKEAINDYHIDSISSDKIQFEPGQLHTHDNKGVLDQITGLGSSGVSTDVARADHDHPEYLSLDSGGIIDGDLTLTGRIIEMDKYYEVHKRPVFGIGGDLEMQTHNHNWEILTQEYKLFKGAPPVPDGATRYYRLYAVYNDDITGDNPEPSSLAPRMRIVNSSNNTAIFQWKMEKTGSDSHHWRREAYSPFFTVTSSHADADARIEVRINNDSGNYNNDIIQKWLEMHYVELIAYDVYEGE